VQIRIDGVHVHGQPGHLVVTSPTKVADC